MTFEKALKELNIEDYADRIFSSNSHGELCHLNDYVLIAESLEEDKKQYFRALFLEAVKYAENNWDRPESMFQHIPGIVIKYSCED